MSEAKTSCRARKRQITNKIKSGKTAGDDGQGRKTSTEEASRKGSIPMKKVSSRRSTVEEVQNSGDASIMPKEGRGR